MILFSAILTINDSLTKDAFVDSVLEWNRTSKYIENVVPNVDLNASYSGKFGDAKRSLEFVDDPERDLMAVRHEKVTADAVVWDTDYVVNFDEKKISIRLDRTYSEDALVMNVAFSTPHFITILIEGGYLADDQDLPVLRTPMEFAGDMETLGGKYRLPVVYVTKTSDGQDVIDTSWLASKLKGAAHVLVETEKPADTDEFGLVTIYYPPEILPKKRIVYRSTNGNLNARLERVVKLVIQYWNAQTIDLLYTWQGVNNAVLSDSFNRQMVRYQETEKARQQAEEEKDLGMTISDDGKHYKLTYRDDPPYMVIIGKTPSDNRAGNNNAALINMSSVFENVPKYVKH